MSFARFTVFTAAGAGLWVTVLALLGYLIGDRAAESENVLRTTTLAAAGVVLVLVVLYVAGKKYFARQVGDEPA